MTGILEFNRVQRGTVPFDEAISIARQRPFGNNLTRQIAQFEMILTFYKGGVEIPHLLFKGKDPEREAQHRTILTEVLSLGESVLRRFSSLSEEEQEGVGYDQNFLSSNVQYLRDKYQQWYGAFDREQAERDFVTLQNALSEAAH